MKKKLSIGTIIILILAGLCLVWGFYLKGKVNTGADTLKDAIYIEDGALDKANDGKTVVVNGNVRADEYVYDDVVGLTLKTICAYRTTEYLKLKYTTDDNGTKDYFFEWSKDISTNSNMSCRDLYGKASLGEFSLDNSILKRFKKSNYYSDFDFNEIRYPYWTYVEDPNKKAYITSAPVEYTENGPDYLKRATRYDEKYAGQFRVSYSYVPLNAGQSYTIVGVQQNDRIVAIPELLTSVFEGKLSVDEITAKLTKHEKSNARIPFIIAIILLAIAIFKIVLNSKNPSYSTGTSKYAKQTRSTSKHSVDFTTTTSAEENTKNDADITIDIE